MLAGERWSLGGRDRPPISSRREARESPDRLRRRDSLFSLLLVCCSRHVAARNRFEWLVFSPGVGFEFSLTSCRKLRKGYFNFQPSMQSVCSGVPLGREREYVKKRRDKVRNSEPWSGVHPAVVGFETNRCWAVFERFTAPLHGATREACLRAHTNRLQGCRLSRRERFGANYRLARSRVRRRRVWLPIGHAVD